MTAKDIAEQLSFHWTTEVKGRLLLPGFTDALEAGIAEAVETVAAPLRKQVEELIQDNLSLQARQAELAAKLQAMTDEKAARAFRVDQALAHLPGLLGYHVITTEGVTGLRSIVAE